MYTGFRPVWNDPVSTAPSRKLANAFPDAPLLSPGTAVSSRLNPNVPPCVLSALCVTWSRSYTYPNLKLCAPWTQPTLSFSDPLSCHSFQFFVLSQPL